MFEQHAVNVAGVARDVVVKTLLLLTIFPASSPPGVILCTNIGTYAKFVANQRGKEMLNPSRGGGRGGCGVTQDLNYEEGGNWTWCARTRVAGVKRKVAGARAVVLYLCTMHIS